MIDIHCHILPGIDDGPANLQQSLHMAKIAVADGITTIVASSHVSDEPQFKSTLNASTAAFNTTLAEHGIPLQIISGGEFSMKLDPKLVEHFTINNGRYVLVEFPHTYLPKTALEQLFHINMQGFIPIIAHPERNVSILHNPDLLSELMAANVMVQVTAGSVCGDFGRDVQYCARYLLKNGMVNILASDAHDDQFRKPVLSKALKIATKLIGKEKARELVFDTPKSVMFNEYHDGVFSQSEPSLTHLHAL